jgi:hypothetical protein
MTFGNVTSRLSVFLGGGASERFEELLTEAGDICRRAAANGGDEARVCHAFEHALARDVRGWLRRAEAATGRREATDPNRLRQVRVLVDHVNVAILSHTSAREAWHAFYQCALSESTINANATQPHS